MDSFTVLRPGGRTASMHAKTLATISAGKTVTKDGKTFPQASRDGEMFVNSEERTAQGIRAYLKNRKSITIAFVSNDINEIISQRFKKESLSKLEFTGDQYFLTVFSKDDKPRKVYAETPEYDQLIATSKTEASIYFLLVEMLPGGGITPLFPDGLGLYRIRTGSPNSVDNAKACLNALKVMTGGKCAGIPVEVFLTYPELTGPDGAKRKCPVFQFVGQENASPYQFVLPGHAQESIIEKPLLLEDTVPLSLPFPTPGLPSYTTGEVELAEPDISWTREELIENIRMAKAKIERSGYEQILKTLNLDSTPSNKMTERQIYDLYEALYTEIEAF